jgi:hypothetical protein
MQKIHQLMQDSDGIFVASPVYFSTVTAQTKVSSIFTQNQPDVQLYQGGIGSFMYAVELSGLTVKDYMIAGDLDTGFKPPVTEGRNSWTGPIRSAGSPSVGSPVRDEKVPWAKENGGIRND